MNRLDQLPDELKFRAINVESDANMPSLTEDGQTAWGLYRAGLTCRLGAIMYSGISTDPMEMFLGGSDVRQKLADAIRAGEPVFVGPSAMVYNGVMTVISSDVRSSSFGLWTPREGVEVQPDSIPYTRLN